MSHVFSPPRRAPTTAGFGGSVCGSNCCCWTSRWNCLFLQSSPCWRRSAQSSWLQRLLVSELFPGLPRLWRGAQHRAAQVQALGSLCSHPHGLGSIRMHWMHIADGCFPASERSLGCNAKPQCGNRVDSLATMPSGRNQGSARLGALFLVCFWCAIWFRCHPGVPSPPRPKRSLDAAPAARRPSGISRFCVSSSVWASERCLKFSVCCRGGSSAPSLSSSSIAFFLSAIATAL